MKTYNVYNNGHDSKINCNLPGGRTMCKNLSIEDLKDYIRKKVTLDELGRKYFN